MASPTCGNSAVNGLKTLNFNFNYTDTLTLPSIQHSENPGFSTILRTSLNSLPASFVRLFVLVFSRVLSELASFYVRVICTSETENSYVRVFAILSKTKGQVLNISFIIF